ncbi:putative major facilitator superfamily transporter [Rosellinia necatrix]|uniref:Putative major facilitator superfamily transporter n=1 Tax=Rosellinia necatrix TaxID=77044 RepID=A0A1W2TAE6_ROSNE|nr:putative major facilitator superfamily transporter [Rosellinia necatrix]
MSSPDETTSLLHSGQNGDAIEADHHITNYAPRGEVSTKIIACGSTDTDIEANEIVPCTNDATGPAKISTSSLSRVVAVLMIGLFTSNIDSSLVLATHPRIASEFDALEDSSWLFVSFLLGGVATQVLYAKLSDVYGRRAMLVFCYALFGTGCTIIGLSQSMWHVILGRVLSGSGGSGMGALVLVLTTDLIPLRDVASWLGYINIVSTTARSIGGPLGGFLADRVGWRWSFLGQGPLFAIAMTAAILVIPNTKAPEPERSTVKGVRAWLSRIDFAGSLLLGIGILLLMLPIEIGGVKVPWTHPIIFSLLGAGVLTLGVFVINEARWAEVPAFPLRLIKNRDILLPYITICCIAGAQTSLMYFVPLYFQVTSGASNTLAGLHLVPGVVGNAMGGLVAGSVIRRTGGYKAVILGSSLLASIGYTLLVVRWLGHTNWWESLYILPGGFGAGMSGSAVFVSLNAVVEPAHKAVVTSGLQLAMPIGMLIGVSAGSAVMLDVLQRVLDKNLLEIGLGFESRAEIIRKSIANVDYIRQLPSHLGYIVVNGYVVALRASFGVILLFSLAGLSAGFFLRERRL